MTTPNWQPQFPINAVVFDCDGTLSSIEGIDVLAEHNGVGSQVTVLTAEAMGRSGMNIDIYRQRLNLVNPTRDQLQALGHEYYANRVEDSEEVIQVLNRLNKAVYVISAGLFPSVKLFSDFLQIPDNNIFAVDIYFNEDGSYRDFDRQSPLVTLKGKRVMVSKIKEKHTHILYTGDGLNDYETYDLATRYVGYGGVFYRQNIADLCEYYISSLSLSPLLPLLLTLSEYESLTLKEKNLYDKGLAAILADLVKC